uniref:Transposase (putative) gypsy type domain-containing protein n=1 Tax=Tanacetum cinerariifolium TaxID=118510 RepID=A0A6L2JJK8_TANCI|nr:hypothetical protein [Tanacetum cinerariifolium]
MNLGITSWGITYQMQNNEDGDGDDSKDVDEDVKGNGEWRTLMMMVLMMIILMMMRMLTVMTRRMFVMKIKSVLTQKGLMIFCETFYISDGVHPQLSSRNQTIHEMPTGKICVYTRFFEYSKFRFPFSTFLVNVLRYYRINLSQLSLIAAAKVYFFEILCRVHGVEPTVGLFRCFYVNSKNKGWMSFSKRPDSDAVCYTKPLDSLKCWNDHFFWVNSFSCPVSFSRHTGKTVSGDPFPKSREFRADDYVVLVAYPAPFRKYPKPFFCLIGMSRNYTLDEDTYPTFLLDDVTGHVVSLLLVSLTGVESELEASVERSDYGTSSGTVNAGKCPSNLKELLASSILNVESGVEIVATLPFVTSSVSATPEHESGVPADSVTWQYIRLIGASERFVVSLDSSQHSITNAFEAEGDSIIRSVVVSPVMTEVVISTYVASIPSASAPEPSTKVITLVYASMFHDSESTGTVRPDAAGFSHVLEKELLMGSQEDDSKSLYNVFVPRWNILNDALLDNLDASREFIDHLAPLLLFARRLEFKFEKKSSLLKAKDDKVKGLKVRLILKETKAAEAIRLRAKVSKFEVTEKSLQDETNTLKEHNTLFEKEQNALDAKMTDLKASGVHKMETSSFKLQDKVKVYENCMEQLERFQDDQMKVVYDKFDQLYTDFVEMSLHLEERLYPYLLTTIFCCRWLLAQGMQNGLSVGITHGKEGRLLTDVAAHNPSAEADYIFALQKLQNVNFSLLAELKYNKDASVKIVMDIIHLEEPLAEKLGLKEFQLTGTKSTSDIVSTAANTIMALSTTLASTRTVPPITIEDYEVMGTDGPEDAQGSGQGKVASIPNTVEFKKELLDTTLECNPPS